VTAEMHEGCIESSGYFANIRTRAGDLLQEDIYAASVTLSRAGL
jgi:hypothetical protein